METKTIKTELRADCPYCKKTNALRHTGDGEWVCEGRCRDVYPESIVNINNTRMVEVQN
jgi:ribosomal protein L37AE/L43A